MNKTLRDISSLSGISGLGLLAGMVTQAVLARRFGVGSQLDILFAAQTVPSFVFGQIAFSLGVSFLPVFAQLMERGGEQGAWEYANNFLNSVALIGLALSGVLALAAPHLVVAFVPWLKPAEIALAVTVFRIAVVGGFLNCLFQLIGYLHYHQGRFALVGAAGLLVNVCMMLGVLLFPGAGIYAVAMGLLTGHVLKLGIAGRGFAVRYRPRLSWSCRGSRSTYKAAAPMLGSAAVGKADPLIERMVTSSLAAGAISSLGLAGKIVTSLAALTTSGVSTVVFPALARLAAAGQMERVGQTLTRFVGQTFMLVMPLAAFMAFFRREIVRFLFERGQFTPAMTEQVSAVVACFCGFFVLSGIGSILSRGFYTLGKTKIPAAISIAGTGVYLALAFGLSRVMGVTGVALALSLEYLFGFLCQLFLLRRYYTEFAPLLIIRKALEYGGWAGVSGLVVYAAMSHVHALFDQRIALCLSLGMGVLLLGTVYFGGLLLVQEPDALALSRRLRLYCLSRHQRLAAPVVAPID